MPSPRIVSLLAAGTEIVHALGGGDSLVGISHECDFPKSCLHLPRLSEPRLDPTRTGTEIDRQVRALVAEGISPYKIDLDRLRELSPDLIVTQDQCEVCAVSGADLRDAIQELAGLENVEVVSLRPFCLEDVFASFEQVGEAMGKTEEAARLVKECTARLQRVRERVAGLARPSALLIEWMDPVFLAGGWAPELIEIAGGNPVGPDPGGKSPQAEWGEVLDLDPSVLFLSPCGYDLDKTKKELGAIATREGFSSLRAVQDERCWMLDGNALLHRSGPRIIDSVELLAALLHPPPDEELMLGTWAERIPAAGRGL